MEKETMISYRYFKIINTETRSFLRDMRQRLDELERACDVACDGVATDIVAQADLSWAYEKGEEWEKLQ